jgi:uncharacterized membrane protein
MNQNEREKYTKKVKKMIFLQYTILVLAILFSVASKIFHFEKYISTHLLSYIDGFMVGFIVVAIFLGFRYTRAVRKGKLDELLIEQYDERNIRISEKAGAVAINIIPFGFIFAGIVSSFFSVTVFKTLLFVTIFTLLVRLILTIYYSKRL